MANDYLLLILTAVLSGGVFHFALGLYQSWRAQPAVSQEMRKMAQESDSAAVTTMKEALGVSTDRNGILEEMLELKDRQLLDKDRRINELEARILTLQKQLSGMQSTLSAMSVELEALRQLARRTDPDDDSSK